MKKVFFAFALLFAVSAMTGCSSGGGGMGPGSSSLASEEISSADFSVIESSLLANRIEALETNPLPAADVAFLPDQFTPVAGSFQHRGKRFQGGKQGQSRGARRGEGRCQVALNGSIASGAQLWVASEACQVSKTETGGYRIVRRDSTVITVEKPADGSGRTTLGINGITWAAYFGDGESSPLVTLKNDLSGRTMIINEDDAGTLTITMEGGRNFRGYWNSDGTLEATDMAGQQYRYRGGRTV